MAPDPRLKNLVSAPAPVHHFWKGPRSARERAATWRRGDRCAVSTPEARPRREEERHKTRLEKSGRPAVTVYFCYINVACCVRVLGTRRSSEFGLWSVESIHNWKGPKRQWWTIDIQKWGWCSRDYVPGYLASSSFMPRRFIWSISPKVSCYRTNFHYLTTCSIWGLWHIPTDEKRHLWPTNLLFA